MLKHLLLASALIWNSYFHITKSFLLLEDMLTAAVNEAISKVESEAEHEMGALTSGMNLPNIPGLGL